MRRHAFPRKFFCPGRKKRRIMIGEMIFPVAPRNFLYYNTLAVRTTDPAHRIAKEYAQSPHWDKFKQSFRQCIITGRSCPADTANRFAIGSSLYFHDNGIFLFVRANFKSIGSLVLITCFFVRQNRFGALIQTFSQKTAKNQISGRFPPLPSTRDVLDILLFTSA